MWKFKWNMSKEKWLMILAAGACLMILAMPSGKIAVPSSQETAKELEVQSSAGNGRSYEKELEKRVKEFLSTVDGVGEVDVMITVKSSGEKVLRVDTDSSISSTEETDSSGGVRNIRNKELQESTVLTGNDTPIVEKELMPEIEGVVISADGGGSAEMKAEISAAIEALFHVPQHKIRVLKRVE